MLVQLAERKISLRKNSVKVSFFIVLISSTAQSEPVLLNLYLAILAHCTSRTKGVSGKYVTKNFSSECVCLSLN